MGLASRLRVHARRLKRAAGQDVVEGTRFMAVGWGQDVFSAPLVEKLPWIYSFLMK